MNKPFLIRMERYFPMMQWEKLGHHYTAEVLLGFRGQGEDQW